MVTRKPLLHHGPRNSSAVERGNETITEQQPHRAKDTPADSQSGKLGRRISDSFHESRGDYFVPTIDDPRDVYSYEWLHLYSCHDLSIVDIIASTGSIAEFVQRIHFVVRTGRVESFTLDLIIEFWVLFPEAASHLLIIFQQYGCWQHLVLLLERAQRSKETGRDLVDAIYRLLRDQWVRDLHALFSEKKRSPSNLVDWLPRPRTELDLTLDFTHNFVRFAYPKAHKAPHSWELYKRHLKALRSAVKNQRSGIIRRVMLTNGVKALPNHGISRTGPEPLTSFVEFQTPATIASPLSSISHRSMSGLAMSDLPMPSEGRIDEILAAHPLVRDRCATFLATPVRRLNSSTTDRVLYIHQGEVGYAIPSQTDVIMSDRATTCHILSIQSAIAPTKGSPLVPALVSLTHLDAVMYTDCIHDIIHQHLSHHKDTGSSGPLQLVVDVIGGFNDVLGTSGKISCWLLKVLALLAEDLREFLTMTLCTCAISCMNDNGAQSPVGRGMGIDMRSGEVFLASCDLSCAPAMQLRNARIWAGGGYGKLAVVHTPSNNRLTIQPFEFGVFDKLAKYLRMPDALMIRHTSTSPDVEEEDFCSSVRNTLRFIQAIDCERVFGPGLNQPISFERVASSNVWRRC